MERVLSGDEKIKKAEEIYYKRKMGIPNSKNPRIEGEKKSYLGSKILLQILVIANLSIIIMAIQNKGYIFTDNFLNDVQKYNINITQAIKDFIGIEDEEVIENNKNNELNRNKEMNTQITNEINVMNQEFNNELNSVVNTLEGVEESKNSIEEIVPNDEVLSSSLSEMEQNIIKVNEIVSIQKPIFEGTITSRFGARESTHKTVEGYHTGIDIGAVKRHINLFSNFAVKPL